MKTNSEKKHQFTNTTKKIKLFNHTRPLEILEMNTYLECWSLSSIRGRTAGIISRGKIWLTMVNAMHTSTRLVLCKSCYNH